MFWGCFSARGLGPIVPLVGSVTGDTHVTILNKHVVSTMKKNFPKGDGWFQEDNAPPHRSKIAAEFRAKKIFAPFPGLPKVRILIRSKISGLNSRKKFKTTSLPAYLHFNGRSEEPGSPLRRQQLKTLLKVCHNEFKQLLKQMVVPLNTKICSKSTF